MILPNYATFRPSANQVTYTPSGAREGFPNTEECHGALEHVGQGSKVKMRDLVIDTSLVDLSLTDVDSSCLYYIMCFFCWRFQRFPTVCPRARNSERGLQAGQVNNTKIPKFKYLWWGTHMSSKFAREIKRLKNIVYKTSQNRLKSKHHPYCVITYVYEQFIENHGTHHGNARLIRDDQQSRVFFHHCGDGLQLFLSEDLPQRRGGGVEHQNPVARAG